VGGRVVSGGTQWTTFSGRRFFIGFHRGGLGTSPEIAGSTMTNLGGGEKSEPIGKKRVKGCWYARVVTFSGKGGERNSELGKLQNTEEISREKEDLRPLLWEKTEIRILKGRAAVVHQNKGRGGILKRRGERGVGCAILRGSLIFKIFSHEDGERNSKELRAVRTSREGKRS